jgi:hypothetical protein
MNIRNATCQFNLLQAFGLEPKAVAAVFFWWFGYGFYFSQSPGRP